MGHKRSGKENRGNTRQGVLPGKMRGCLACLGQSPVGGYNGNAKGNYARLYLKSGFTVRREFPEFLIVSEEAGSQKVGFHRPQVFIR